MSEQLSLLPDAQPTATNHYDQFWQFIYERHLIWYKRFVLGQQPPWTEDRVMRDYKFTNVYRELDRGTLYLLDNIIGVQNAKYGIKEEQVLRCIMYRMFNRISTWEQVNHVNPGRLREMEGILREMQQHQPIYTDAHMVCAYEHFPGSDKLERIMYIFKNIIANMGTIMRTINTAKSLETIWKVLTEQKGLGPFLSYEIAVDISYAPWNNLGEDEWVNPGPGCQRGLRYIYPNHPGGVTEFQWSIKQLRQAQRKEFDRLDLPFFKIAYKGRELTLRNVEHCCCEFQKYVKGTEGTGRPRNRFKANAEQGTEDFNRLRG